MSAQNNPEPAPLRAGLIATPDELPALFSAIEAVSGFRLVAQSGVPRDDAKPEVEWFADARALLAQARIEVLLLATAPSDARLLAQEANGREIAVWRRGPLARHFGQASDLVRQLTDGNRTYYHSFSRWEQVADTLHSELEAHGDQRPVFAELFVSGTAPETDSWRANGQLAVGGVLAQSGYAWLEMLTAVRGIPDSVFAVTGRSRDAGLRETEDAAIAIFRYQDGGLALLRGAWNRPPTINHLRLHMPGETIEIGAASLRMLLPDGVVQAEQPLPTNELAEDLTRFVAAVRRQSRPNPTTLERHLAVQAILEAAYLSARTGQPEFPRRFYEVQGWAVPQW